VLLGGQIFKIAVVAYNQHHGVIVTLCENGGEECVECGDVLTCSTHIAAVPEMVSGEVFKGYECCLTGKHGKALASFFGRQKRNGRIGSVPMVVGDEG